MKKDLAILVIHGIGRQEPDFAAELIENVNAQVDVLGSDPARIAWQSIFWDDILSTAQDAYLHAAFETNELSAKRLRSFLLSALGDAASYRQLPSGGRRGGEENITYRRVHARVRDAVTSLYRDQLASRAVPLVGLAHSFGGHILSNYIWDLQRRPDGRLSPFERMNWLTGLITFGCNIPLFTFACREIVPIQFPPPRLPKRLKGVSRWVNYFDPDDLLAWPLKPINAAYASVVVGDERINVGGPVTGSTPVSHLAYWQDQKFAGRIAHYLQKILKIS